MLLGFAPKLLNTNASTTIGSGCATTGASGALAVIGLNDGIPPVGPNGSFSNPDTLGVLTFIETAVSINLSGSMLFSKVMFVVPLLKRLA